jgi:Pyruvate phosphate dikinase, AMP/ATP-binding domain
MQTIARAARVADRPGSRHRPPRKWIYDFAEGRREMRSLLGGKGANIAEMTRVLGAELVPAGFTITTEACVEYMRTGHGAAAPVTPAEP